MTLLSLGLDRSHSKEVLPWTPQCVGALDSQRCLLLALLVVLSDVAPDDAFGSEAPKNAFSVSPAQPSTRVPNSAGSVRVILHYLWYRLGVM